MNRIYPIALILLGLTWLFYAAADAITSETAAMSDAMQLESDLKKWAESKVREGKLKNEDVLEIFPEGYSLILGGEQSDRNFREMVADIATRNYLPVWPGLIALAFGTVGLFTTPKNRKAHQGGGINSVTSLRDSTP